MMIQDDLSIVARDVGICYDLRLTSRRTLRQVIGEVIHTNGSPTPPTFWALKQVSFVARAGDIVGVIGRNGSGKSTLLLAIAGILRPDTGAVRTFGRTSTLMTLGAGFDPELNGRENIYLNGAFLGLSKPKVDALLSDIVEFADLGPFIDVPLKKYSTGMRARLGFSIVAHVQSEILLLDEVLAVGDEEFRSRSRERIFELIEQARAIVVVSHDLAFIERTCTKCLWLEHGEVVAFGEPQSVIADYRARSRSGQLPPLGT